VLPILGALIVGGLLYIANVYRNSLLYVSTENAQLTGQPVQVGAMNAGRVATINASIGMAVHKGDVLAQVVLPSQVGTVQNGTPRMDFLGPGDTRVDVAAPIDGVVIAVPSTIGSTVAAGQPIVSLSDPTQIWVNANIDETKVVRLRLGQPVDVYVDALHTTVPGRVEAITPATSAVFSLLPSNTTSGNFTKVTQLVPVRIAVNLGNQPALIGSSVEVKIHVR
jgi:multidrug resistance efflux pump